MSAIETGARSRVAHALEQASQLLPDQGPIAVFVHQNNLHPLEHLQFHDAVAQASRRLGTEAYLPEATFRRAYAEGRITADDLEFAIDRFLPERLAQAPGGRALAEIALHTDLAALPPTVLRWREIDGALARLARLDDDRRAGFVAEASAWLLREIEGVGTTATMAEVVALLVGQELLTAIDAQAERGGPRLPLRKACTRIGLPAERAPIYRERVAARCGRSEEAALERWAAAEYAAVRDALARLEIPATLTGLRDAIAKRPERVAALALWQACRLHSVPNAAGNTHGVRPSPAQVVFAQTGEDPRDLVDPVLWRWCAAYLDLGVASWSMPHRELGLLRAWAQLCDEAGLVARWLTPALASARRVRAGEIDALGLIDEHLTRLGLEDAELAPYIERMLQRLPGWAGMFHRLAHFPNDRPAGAVPAVLAEYLALRLVLEDAAVQDVAARHGLATVSNVSAEAAVPRVRGDHDAAWRLFVLAQKQGTGPEAMRRRSPAERRETLELLDAFDVDARRRLWLEAYERHHLLEVVGSIVANTARPLALRHPARPRAQIMSCIDDRIESFRRALEEEAPDLETISGPGFFGLAIAFRGLDVVDRSALCPVVATPSHQVDEIAVDSQPDTHRRNRRRVLAATQRLLRRAETSPLLGTVSAPVLGLVGAGVLLGSALGTRRVRLRGKVEDVLARRPHTVLRTRGPNGEMTPDEAADRLNILLTNMGLMKNFAPLVVILGHGATTTNNPHQSAYDCGACGGSHGAANARLAATLLNRADIRERLRTRGIDIPDATIFVSGFHDTTSDDIPLFDLELVPAGRRAEVDAVIADLARARASNALERCRRFADAPRDDTSAALRHVQQRSSNPVQPRPEYGHATNAVCVFGRRSLTRGVFMDRRALLASYDPELDPQGTAIERLLMNMGPVGAGISLEYYFSSVDNQMYGCATKIPHNVTCLLGVMDGSGSDLRTGLPRQTVEIHEPMRLLCIIDAPPARVLAVCERQAEVARLATNGWIRVVAIDPEDGRPYWLGPQGFEPLALPDTPWPTVRRSRDWFAGRRDNVPPAIITGADVPRERQDAA